MKSLFINAKTQTSRRGREGWQSGNAGETEYNII